MLKAQLLEAYSFRELQLRLQRVRRSKVPEKTLRRWLEESWIGTKPEYTEADFQRLARLCIHYKQGKSKKTFQDQLLQELRNHAES